MVHELAALVLLSFSTQQTPALEHALASPPGFSAPFAPPPPIQAATRWVAPNGNDLNPGTQAWPWRQIAHAATQVAPGDVVEIADGVYSSPIEIQITASAAQPVIFRARGTGALVDGSGTNAVDRDALFVSQSEHVVVHGLRIQSAFRSGVRVSLSDHCTIQACVCANNGRWGIFTDFSDDLALIGNECFGSVLEHGIYHSNSSDRGLLRGNYCHDNFSSGIQVNADPVAGGDGISSFTRIERNLLMRNGLGTGQGGGGAAINLASVRDSWIENNVIVDNLATGIALWDDGAGSQWGSKDNALRHNTIRFRPNEGRYALSLLNGSTDNLLVDNVLIGGRRGAIAFSGDSLPGLASDFNLLFSLDGWPIVVNDTSGASYTLVAWRALGFDIHSQEANPVFLNPLGGDWSLAPGSAGRDQGVDARVTRDYQSGLRPRGVAFDIGAYER